MNRKHKSLTKKPSGIPRLVRIPPDIDAWLIEKVKKADGSYYVQEVIRDILKAARDAEQGQGQAA